MIEKENDTESLKMSEKKFVKVEFKIDEKKKD